MGLEQKINYQLNKYPAVKKVVKSIYQHGMYAISKKIKAEGDIVRVSPDDSNHEYFFGYYDKSPWDITDRFILCLKANDTWSDVSPKEKADILLIDTQKSESDPNRVKKIAETRAWNVQQACMLQWLGPDFSSRIIYNDFRDNKYVSVILNITTGEERVLGAPTYSVSADGKTALTLDFSRLYNLRPGYGYYNLTETTKGVALPDTNAVWKINLDSGDITPLLKYTDFAAFQPRPEMLEKGAIHKVNHLMISPNGQRFMVLYRWFNGERKYTRLITCNMDGKDMYVLSDDDMVSHCFWKDDEHILAFENKKGSGTGYYLMKDKTQKYQHCWSELAGDGHPSYSPDRSHIVTDSYPDRTRIQYLRVMNSEDSKPKIIAKVFSPFKYDNDTRCDLHPRWNHKGDNICFDGVFEGHRGIYTVNIKSKDKIHVLYVTDNLKQRFGVTSVIMNYYRNIDKNDVVIDFMCWKEGNDSEIIKEIENNKSRIFYMPKLGIGNYFNFKRYMSDFWTEYGSCYDVVHSHFCQLDNIIFPIARKNGVKACISHSHNTKLSDYKVRAIRNRLMCFQLAKQADYLAACSEVAGEFLFGNIFKKAKNKVLIHNAIDIKKFSYNTSVRRDIREKIGVTDKFVIGNVGSLKPQKNQTFLLDIYAKFVKERPEIKSVLLLVGDGQLRQDLERKAELLGIQNQVMFMGVRKDVSDLLQAVDLFILPSLYEGLPVIGVEAQTAGLPCLLSDTITREVDLCNTKYLSLKRMDEWTDLIYKYIDFERTDTTNLIRDKGYDISVEAKKLVEFYKGIV